MRKPTLGLPDNGEPEATAAQEARQPKRWWASGAGSASGKASSASGKPSRGAGSSARADARSTQNSRGAQSAGSAAHRDHSGGTAGRTASSGGGRLKSFRVSGLTFAVAAVLVVFVIVITPGLRVFIEQRQQLAALQQDVADKQQQNEQLDAEIARWQDPAYIKAQARDRLYFVMPGETSFLIIDDAAPTADQSPTQVSTTIQTTKVDWLSALLASGLTAGLSTQTPDQLQETGQVQ